MVALLAAIAVAMLASLRSPGTSALDTIFLLAAFATVAVSLAGLRVIRSGYVSSRVTDALLAALSVPGRQLLVVQVRRRQPPHVQREAGEEAQPTIGGDDVRQVGEDEVHHRHDATDSRRTVRMGFAVGAPVP